MSSDAFREVEQAALRLLASREHSREQLRGKLARRYPTTLVDEVLTRLAANGLQSDDRFAACYVEERRRKGYGPLRVCAELRERGVDASVIAAWVDTGDTSWGEALHALVERKYGARPAGDVAERAKRARFLEYRGYPSDQVRRSLFAHD